MIKGLMREVTLAVQSKTGVTPAVFVWLALVAIASVTAFAFLCVAAYAWLSILFGSILAGLIVAGFFIVVAAFAAMLAALTRRRARESAILERAARAHAGSWLLDPKLLASALQIGRSLGWQRILPVVLLGFVAAQWAREQREEASKNDE
jgi:hypothetical protein